MRAVIMAGGEGRRLRPITCTMPKPMVPLLNKPIVDYTMELLKRHGIHEAVYTLHYMGEKIKQHVGDGSAWGLRCTYAESESPLGTAGSVKQAVKETDEDILVLSGDGITDVDLSAVIKAHEASGAEATIVLKKVPSPTEYGVALLDDEGSIVRFIEKPEQSEVFSDLANTGIYILSRRALNLIPDRTEFDFSKQLFPEMLNQGMMLKGFITESYWCDIGDISEYRRAQRDMLDGRVRFETIARNYSGIYYEPNAHISDSAVLIPPCYIGSGVSIGDEAIIEPYTVIGSGSVVERGSSLKRSILFDNVRIRREAQIRAAVVCENAHIDDRASLYEGSTIGAGTHVGAGVSVLPNVSIWPEKELEGGLSCRDNIVWGNPINRIGISGSCIKGYTDTGLTPETALRIGAAYASKLRSPAKVAVCSDGSQSAVMLVYALISGITSQGVDVKNVGVLGKSAFSLTVSQLGTDGGLYVEGNENHGSIITLYDSMGIEASQDCLRSVRSAFVMGEQKPRVDVELGIVSRAEGMEEMFENRLSRLLDTDALRRNPKTLRINANEQIVRCVTGILLRLGWNVESLRKESRLIPVQDENTLAILQDSNGALSLSFQNGGKSIIMDEQEIITALSVDAIEHAGMKQLVLPVTLPEEYRSCLKTHGADLLFAPEDSTKLRRAAFERGHYYAPLYEREAGIMKLAELFATGELAKIHTSLPKIHSSENRVPASRNDIGRMLRSLAESERNSDRELVDGLRLRLDSGWVVVKPYLGRTASFRIVAGAASGEYAKELCDIYTEKLERIRDNKEDSK